MGLKEAREAIASTIAAGISREANVKEYELKDGSLLGRPRVWIEFGEIEYYANFGGGCRKAIVRGAIVIEVPTSGTEADVNNALDEYTDPHGTHSVVAVVMAQTVTGPAFGGAMDSFVATRCEPRDFGSRQIPFELTLTSPGT